MTTPKKISPKNDDLTLKYSHNIIEHLGLKLYQNKPTNVIAELVSNSWDADASKVLISISSNQDAEQVISVIDDGNGMSLKDLKDNYLVIGKKKKGDRKTDSDTRTPMGRKGIGKLAPFGIANTVIVVTVKNSLINAFELNYREMIDSTKDEFDISAYKPSHILNNINYENFTLALEKYNESALQEDKKGINRKKQLSSKTISNITDFIENTEETGHGTMVLCNDIKLRKIINPDTLISSLGKRFTVILNRPDFKVRINGVEISESMCFPDWALRIPNEGTLKHELILPNANKDVVEVRYWVAFVDKAEWATDQAGVGVYAHGKIAQDRPFTFGVKGMEIFTRYMYAVIEADWIDEFAEDEISTDRTSINWDNEIFDSFHEWGSYKVRDWVKKYKTVKKEKAEAENLITIENVISEKEINIKPSEKKHLNKIISEITPTMSPDIEQKNRLIEATLKAWTHEPARNLIKKLWNETSEVRTDEFSNLIFRLEEELVPESLSLAVMFSQRVYAMTKLEKNIQLKKETHLQILIETFPWILGSDYEKLIYRKSLKNIVQEAIDTNVFPVPEIITNEANDKKQPDFVFLADSNDETIVVVELKGPDITAEWPEFQQLRNYVDYLQSRFPNSMVGGILIAGGFNSTLDKQRPPSIEFCNWDTVLKNSKKEHIKYLTALLDGADADASDPRVKQVCELGGPIVITFLKKMSETSDSLAQLMKQIEHQESKRVRKVKPN